MNLNQPNAQTEMGILEHLGELRYRLLISVVALICASTAMFFYTNPIMAVLNAPYLKAFANSTLIGTGPAEAFMLRLKVSVFAGIIVASPIIFYQFWLFIAPGLHEHEKKAVFPISCISCFLFLVGVTFCYYAILPFALEFFHAQYKEMGITATIRISEYLSGVLMALIGFGAVFEMPVLAYFLGKLGVIDDKMLIASTRYAVVIIFIVAAILTPPDVLTQLLMAGPLLALYGLSILIVRYTGKPRAEDEVS